MTGEHEGEHCHDCGSAYSSVYRVPDDVWAVITPALDRPGGGLLCMSCAERRARDAGIGLEWTGCIL